VITPADGPILWVSGVPGVGTSMVGYTIYQRTLHSGRMVGYLDLRQVGFCAHDGVDHRLRAGYSTCRCKTWPPHGAIDGAQVNGLWREFRDEVTEREIRWC
jgi:hypothetical protein